MSVSVSAHHNTIGVPCSSSCQRYVSCERHVQPRQGPLTQYFRPTLRPASSCYTVRGQHGGHLHYPRLDPEFPQPPWNQELVWGWRGHSGHCFGIGPQLARVVRFIETGMAWRHAWWRHRLALLVVHVSQGFAKRGQCWDSWLAPCATPPRRGCCG